MLVLSRKVGDSIKIGDNIEIVVNRISGNRVTIGVDAPKDVRILRGEVELELDDDAVLALSSLITAIRQAKPNSPRRHTTTLLPTVTAALGDHVNFCRARFHYDEDARGLLISNFRSNR